ncbi:Sulfotransferase [Ectocarpus siliculosus]|uniref:Sulfotransferase n=1 Tax=Ectocarpus siliculosus TaxID=2880 RepID=D8LLL8_ECTSI|nr:Sulfotransferase [Ectocarpus siliculosus]|eukprot:CBN74649.1 Sulfotransferase [Ectocarpus siliculosus]
MVAAVVSLVLALAFLPIILTGPSDPATPMPPMPATPPDDLDSGGGVADPGREKPAPPAASASGVARRVELAAAAVAGRGSSSSSSSSASYSDNHESRQGFDGQQSWRREQEEGGGGGWAGGGDSGVPEDLSAGRAAGGGATGVVAEGEGGKLRDGRNRCFVGAEGDHRCYPTVFFFGTSKCGTTSLARWLDHHPATHWVANPRRPHQIEETGVKEAHVFDDPPKGDPAFEEGMHHEKLFITTPKSGAEDVVIDYTPHYIAVAETPHRIADIYGGRESGLKFIVTLREPAGRAISSWEFKNEYNPKKGRREESRSLAKTIEDGGRRAMKLHACLALAKSKAVSPRDRDLKLCNPRKFLEVPLYVSHVGKSMYALQLERWFDLFGRENFKVVFTDDMAVDPVGVLEDVLHFLGLELTSEDESKGLPDMKGWKKITGMAYNKTKSKKKDELGDQVTDEVKEGLRKFFEPHNEALEEILGQPLPEAWGS